MRRQHRKDPSADCRRAPRRSQIRGVAPNVRPVSSVTSLFEKTRILAQGSIEERVSRYETHHEFRCRRERVPVGLAAEGVDVSAQVACVRAQSLSAGGFGPNDATIRVRPGPVRTTLIRPRTSFVPEMLKSVENL